MRKLLVPAGLASILAACATTTPEPPPVERGEHGRVEGRRPDRSDRDDRGRDRDER